MGLLDAFNSPEMAFGMGLLQAGGPSPERVSLGQGLAQGYKGFQQAQDLQSNRADKDQERQMRKMQLAQLLQTQQGEAAFVSKLPPDFQAAWKAGAKTQVLEHLFKEKTPEKPQLVEIADPRNPGKSIKQWVLPGQSNGTVVGESPPPNELNPDVQKNRIAVAAAGRAGPTNVTVMPDSLGLKPKDKFEMEGKLRDDYVKQTDTDNKIVAGGQKLRSILSGDPTAMQDQAAIYSFAKLLDPDGAVREADYAAIMGTTGLVDRVKNSIQRLQNGQALSPTQRKEMESVLDKFDAVAKKRIGVAQKSYSGRAKMYNLDPNAVFQLPEADEAPANSVDALIKKYGGK